MEKMEPRKNRIFRRLVAWIPSFSWMTLIFLLSSRQSVSVAEEFWINFVIFKFLHVAEYFILNLLIFRALRINHPQNLLITNLLLASLASIMYAISDEVHQTFVPTRQGKAWDVLIDSIGIFSVYSLVLLYEKNKKFFASFTSAR
jgi:hypothetical protein